MRRPKVAHNPSVTLKSRGLSRSESCTAPTCRNATPGATRHSAYASATSTTTSATMPITSETTTPSTTPITTAGSTAASAHRTMAWRRLAVTSSGRISVAPETGLNDARGQWLRRQGHGTTGTP